MDECRVSECLLRKAAGQPGLHCEEARCTFWTEVGDGTMPPQTTCAIQYFDLLGGDGVGLAIWLLAMKERHHDPTDDAKEPTAADNG